MAKKARLVKSTITELVRRIGRDIPKIDYDSVIQDYFNKRALEELPDVLKSDLVQVYLKREYLYDVGIYVCNNQFKTTPSDSAFVRAQRLLRDQQNTKLEAVESSLRAEFEDCRYVDVFNERFPEFVKYLPKEAEPIVNLPAVQLKETLASLGWPKSDEGK